MPPRRHRRCYGSPEGITLGHGAATPRTWIYYNLKPLPRKNFFFGLASSVIIRPIHPELRPHRGYGSFRGEIVDLLEGEELFVLLGDLLIMLHPELEQLL